MAAQSKTNRDMIVALFQDVRAAFPKLEMDLQLDPSQVDLNMDIPRQPGLVCDVNMNLQGDELHFSAGTFHLEWFPASEERILELYREAVYNWLRGEFRILEHCRGDKVVKADLQCQLDNGDWKTIGTWSTFSLPIPWRCTTRELKNTTGGPPH